MAQQLSEAQVVARYERDRARALRAGCSHCGHSWRPRNPSAAVNRCPGCLRYGHVSYTNLSDQIEDTTPLPPAPPLHP